MVQKFALIFLIFTGCMFAQQTCPTGTIPIQAGTTNINSGGQLVLSNGLCINPTTGAVTTVPGGASCTTCYTNQVTPPASLWVPYFQANTINQQGNLSLSNPSPSFGTRLQTASNAVVAGDCAKFVSNGDLQDAGAPCGSGGGGVTSWGGGTGVITLGPNGLTFNSGTGVADISQSIVMGDSWANAPSGQQNFAGIAAGSKAWREVSTLPSGTCTLNEQVFLTSGSIGAYYCSTASPAAWTAIGGSSGGGTGLSQSGISGEWLGNAPISSTSFVTLPNVGGNLVPVVYAFPVTVSSMSIKHVSVAVTASDSAASCIVAFYNATTGLLVGNQSTAFTPSAVSTPAAPTLVTFPTPVTLTNNGSTSGMYYKMLMCSVPVTAPATVSFLSNDPGLFQTFVNAGTQTVGTSGYLATQGSLTAPASLGTINLYGGAVYGVAMYMGS